MKTPLMKQILFQSSILSVFITPEQIKRMRERIDERQETTYPALREFMDRAPKLLNHDPQVHGTQRKIYECFGFTDPAML